MKLFTKKSVIRKIATLFLIVTLFNFAFPTFSQAGIGGLLFDPIVDLITTIGDAILSALQVFLYTGGGVGEVARGVGTWFVRAAFMTEDNINNLRNDIYRSC